MATTISRNQSARDGVFRRLLAGAIDARQRQARRQLNALLLSLDDATLATFGTERRNIDETCRGPLPL